MDLLIYADAIKHNRVIGLSGEVSQEMVISLRKQATRIIEESPGAEVIITFSTGGGSVLSGLVLLHDVRVFNACTNVSLISQGIVAGIGIDITLAVPRERRFALAPTVFCAQSIEEYSELTTERAGLQPNDYQLQEGRALQKLQKRLICMKEEATGTPRKKWQELIDHPRYVFEDEALELGLIGGILK